MEAMKMENELRSPRAGRVREVRVSEGQAVETGAMLVVLD
jgi:biotin carboxyl carrier protein